ncbi:hypothetical protein ACX0G9_01915 [Flavitalea flava]
MGSDSHEKDRAYGVGCFIRLGRIIRFEQVFLYMSKSDLARLTGIKTQRLLIIRRNPELIRTWETIIIAQIFEVPEKTILKLLNAREEL